MELEELKHHTTHTRFPAIEKAGTILRVRMLPVPLDISELELGELEAWLASGDHPRFHARQIFRWVYQRNVTDFGHMTDLPQQLRTKLAESAKVSHARIDSDDTSIDGTRKLSLVLADSRKIEAVYIPDTPAQTLCISTQVGCAMGCEFCLTGKMGLVRHLSPGEIVGQVRVLADITGLRNEAFNIVLMGMGEPLHNYDATMKALRILTDSTGFGLPVRRITLSTVGIVPGLRRLAAEPQIPNLAVSLHATTDEQRARIVPPSQKYPLADIIDACRQIPLRKRQRMTFEYVLLEGVNDSAADARRLATLIDGLRAKVNIIPLNAAPGIEFTRPPDAVVDRFACTLSKLGVTVSVRKSRGRDIRAACGQLIVEGGIRMSAAQQFAKLIHPAREAP